MKEIIARLRELDSKATPGEWYTEYRTFYNDRDKTILRASTGAKETCDDIWIADMDGDYPSNFDAKFITYTRNNLIAVLDYVDRLEKALTEKDDQLNLSIYERQRSERRAEDLAADVLEKDAEIARVEAQLAEKEGDDERHLEELESLSAAHDTLQRETAEKDTDHRNTVRGLMDDVNLARFQVIQRDQEIQRLQAEGAAIALKIDEWSKEPWSEDYEVVKDSVFRFLMSLSSNAGKSFLERLRAADGMKEALGRISKLLPPTIYPPDTLHGYAVQRAESQTIEAVTIARDALAAYDKREVE